MTIALIILFLLLQAADLGTTRAILARGGRELNPIGRLFLRYGTPGMVVLKIIVSAVFFYCIALVEPRVRLQLLGVACAIYVLVIIHNVRSTRSARRQ